jgi:Mn2+/Fe2+ NRAMP family transporter
VTEEIKPSIFRQMLQVASTVLGTTISPYMFFWQASEETEEERAAHLIGKDGRPRINWGFIHNMRIDTLVGMFFSQVVTWAIIVVTATVLHSNGVTDVRTAADAARALEPLVHTFPDSGYITKVLSPQGSSASVCSPSRCWPDRHPMREQRACSGQKGWTRNSPGRGGFMASL